MPCGLDRPRWRLACQSAREFEPSLRGLEPEPKPSEAVYRLLQDVDGVCIPGGRGDAPSGESRRGVYSLATRGNSDRGEHLGGVACFAYAVVRKPRLDELLEERSCEQVRPANLVEASSEEGLRSMCLAACDAHRDHDAG